MQDHPKDVEFLNTPIINYVQTRTIFRCGVATGLFAMGSSEALGEPSKHQEHETNDIIADAPPAHAFGGTEKGGTATGLGKRKR